jgi:hypothetical protein
LVDSEWQADEFSGLLLAPSHIVTGKTAAEVAKKCGIPLHTAINRVKKAKHWPQDAAQFQAGAKESSRSNQY